MSLTRIGSIGINTGIAFAGVTTIVTLNTANDALSIGATVNVGSGITLGASGDIFATGVSTFSGNLKVGSGVTISPDGDGFYTGVVTATTFSGAVSGTTGTFSGAVSGTTGTFSGAVSGTTGTFSGAVSGTTGTFTSHVSLGDSDELRFGDGNDLVIKHDGSDSRIIDSGTGNLKIQGSKVQLLNADGTEEYLHGIDGGAVTLRHNNDVKLVTASGGVSVTGALTATLATENGSIAQFGLSGQTNNQSFIIKADDSDSLFTFRFGSSNSTYPAVRFNMGADVESMRIDSSGRVMIGNTNASTMSSSSDDLVIGNTTGDHGITVITGNDSSGRIMFADTYTSGTGTYEGQILYYHQNNIMNFYANYTNNTNVLMQLGGDQNQLFLGIDKGSTTTYDNRSAYFHRTTGNSNYISITTGTSLDCGIVFGDSIGNDTGNYESYINHSNSTNDLTFYVNQGNSNRYLRLKSATGHVELGTGNLVLASGAGIDFSATGDGGTVGSELLDDYEEGTFTPAFGGGISASSYYNQSGHYTKVGDQVYAYIYLRANSASTGSANITVTGLPFSTTSTTNYEGGGYITYTNGFFGTTVDDEHFHPMPWISLNSAFAVFHSPGDGNNITGSNTVPGNKYCIFHLRYKTS